MPLTLQGRKSNYFKKSCSNLCTWGNSICKKQIIKMGTKAVAFNASEEIRGKNLINRMNYVEDGEPSPKAMVSCTWEWDTAFHAPAAPVPLSRQGRDASQPTGADSTSNNLPILGRGIKIINFVSNSHEPYI
jgi:hypothetical protein